MPAIIIDHSRQGIFPHTAIQTLRREHTSQRAIRFCTSLIEVAGGQEGQGRSIVLHAQNALLMMGTTPELQAEVAAASTDQVNGVFVQDDYLVIYYLRYAERTFVTTTNRTVACIAAWGGYWGLSLNSPDDTDVRNAGWARLFPNAVEKWIFNGSMPLMPQPQPQPNLHDVLGRLHHTPSWYNERGEWIGG